MGSSYTNNTPSIGFSQCRPWQHSESWWPRLFSCDPVSVAWDDADKDYSDLPPAVAAAHAAAVAKEEAGRQQEAREKQDREKVQVSG